MAVIPKRQRLPRVVTGVPGPQNQRASPGHNQRGQPTSAPVRMRVVMAVDEGTIETTLRQRGGHSHELQPVSPPQVETPTLHWVYAAPGRDSG